MVVISVTTLKGKVGRQACSQGGMVSLLELAVLVLCAAKEMSLQRCSSFAPAQGEVVTSLPTPPPLLG